MQYFAGVDVGSTTIKIVLTDQQQQLLTHYVCPTGSHFHKHTMEALVHLLERENLSRDDLVSIYATGYGRKLFKEADDAVSEITANAVGAWKLGAAKGRVSTVINIGGQDLKIISLDEQGDVTAFTMNDKCAAGTGRFLEMTARNLEVEVEDLGDYHLRAQKSPLTINSTCTVFAESEMIGLLAKGCGKPEIIAGIHDSIARRVARLSNRLNGSLGALVFFDGGPAINQGLVKAIENELQCAVYVPPEPQITTAYGAALIAAEDGVED